MQNWDFFGPNLDFGPKFGTSLERLPIHLMIMAIPGVKKLSQKTNHERHSDH